MFSVLIYALLCPLLGNALSVSVKAPRESSKTQGRPSSSWLSSSVIESYREVNSDLTKRASEGDIFLALYTRADYMSDGARLGAKLEAYHWGIHVTAKEGGKEATSLYHAVNQKSGDAGFEPDPNKFQFEKKTVDPLKQRSLLGRIKIGTQPSEVPLDALDDVLSKVPAPNKNLDPGSSCVTWAICGIQKLQENKVVDKFDTKTFSKRVLDYGEQRFALLKEAKDVQELSKLQQQTASFDPKEFQIIKDKKGINPFNKPKAPSGPKGTIPDPGAPGTFTPIACKRDGSSCQQLAQKSATKQFKAMAEKNGLSGLVTRDQDPVTFSNLRSSVLKKFGDKLTYTTKLAAAKLPGAATKALSVGVWAKQMKDIFSREATALERVAVSTSLIPLAGCVTQSALEDEQGRNAIGNGIDTAACLVADVAAFVPGGQIASFVIHMARALVRVLENIVVPRDPPEHAKTHYQYKWGWQQYFSNVEQTLRSDSFKGNLTAQLSAEKLDVIYMAGEAAGLIEATLEAAASNNTDGSEGADSGDDADSSKDEKKTDAPEVEDNGISDSQPFRRANEDSSDLDQDPSDSSDAGKGNATDMQPQICQAYFERKERLMKSIGDSIETSLEDAFAKYDEGFFNGYHPWLYKHLRQIRGPVPSVSTLEGERDEYIVKFNETYKRDGKPGLKPGPGTDRMRTILQEVFDGLTRDDPCKDAWKPPRRKDEPEPLPGLPAPVDVPKDQADLEAKEAAWREELEGPLTPWAREQQERDKIWAAVREKEIKDKFSGKKSSGEDGGDSPDWKRFDELWDKYKSKDSDSGGAKEGDKEGDANPKQTPKSEDNGGPTNEPRGSNVLLCANGLFQSPCLEAKTTHGKCVSIPEDWDRKVSSVRINEEAGNCNLYKETGCSGEKLDISSPGIDLQDEKNRAFDEQVRSYSCAADPKDAASGPSSSTLFVSKTYSYKDDRQECSFYYSTSKPNDENWIGIFQKDRTPGEHPSWSWGEAKSGSGSALLDCAKLKPGYQAYLLADGGREVLQGPIEL